MPVRRADGSVAIAEPPTGAPPRTAYSAAASSSAGLDNFLEKLQAAEIRDEQRTTPQQTPKLAKAPSKRPLPSPQQQAQPARKKQGVPFSSATALPFGTAPRKKLSEGVEAKEQLHQHNKARAAAQRGGKKISAAAADPSKSLPPLGYLVLGPIAAGAFSTILRCRSKSKGELVAVKSFDNLKCAKDKDVGDARDRELSVLRALSGGGLHPHIANMLEELGGSSAPHGECSDSNAKTKRLCPKPALPSLATGITKPARQALRFQMRNENMRSSGRQLRPSAQPLHPPSTLAACSARRPTVCGGWLAQALPADATQQIRKGRCSARGHAASDRRCGHAPTSVGAGTHACPWHVPSGRQGERRGRLSTRGQLSTP